MLSVQSSGSWKNTRAFLKHIADGKMFSDLDRYGRMGVDALSKATPMESGLTAHSWDYEVLRGKNASGVQWFNTNVHSGAPVAILLQYGHGTGTGGYVAGKDYINPAIQPIFDKIADDVWKKVTHG